jgi:hypothetical protein
MNIVRKANIYILQQLQNRACAKGKCSRKFWTRSFVAVVSRYIYICLTSVLVFGCMKNLW